VFLSEKGKFSIVHALILFKINPIIMPSSKNSDYDVEKIVSKRIDGKGRTLYLIKWKGMFLKITQIRFIEFSFSGYSSSENTWEPEDHVGNCQDMIDAFEAEQTKKNELNLLQRRTSKRSTRFISKNLTNKNGRPTRTSNRNSSTPKREYSIDSISTDDETDNGYFEKKSNSKRSRKSTIDTETTSSIDSYDSDILDTGKLEQILDVRRNKKIDTVEYYIQLKKIKKPLWINSDRLTEDYTQEVVDFLEDKYV
jgi:hypothetical protein